jgi:hypothetical protein
MDPCPDCGFVYGALPQAELAGALESYGPLFADRLAGSSDSLRARRSPDEWSPLEYACHIRDVLLMQRDRLYVALVEEEPSFKPMYREERVEFDDYASQEPSAVAHQVVMAATLTSHAFAGLGDDQWGRLLIYGYPRSMHRDVEWMAHHTLHEEVHHLADIDRILSGR